METIKEEKKAEYKFMTEKQKMIYDYYSRFEWDTTPTYSQASKDLWICPSVLYNQLNNLIRKWFVSKDTQGWIHIVDNLLDNKIISIAQNMRPWIKLPNMWKSKNEWIDLLRCAILKKNEENKEIEKLIDNLY